MRMSLPASAFAPAAASCCWSGWASPTTGRSACRSTISRPPGCAACSTRCAPRRRITEALKAVGVSDYLRQITRVTARLPNAEEAELLRMPRNRPLLVTENVNVDRAGTVVEFGIVALSNAARADRLRTLRARAMDRLRITGGQRAAALGRRAGGGRCRWRMAASPASVAAAAAAELDARGLLVLPGIVDIHGDAFERQLQPRPGVGFPADIALHDTEAQLLANGITTAFHGVTLSWEPGLRSLDAWQALLDALEARRWTCDMRVHLRWEAYNLDALDIALADIAAGRVHLLAFNDHTPPILKKIEDPVAGAKYSDRAGMKLDEFRALAERGRRARDCGAGRAGTACRGGARGRPADGEPRRRDRRHAQTFRAHGARICEFPMAEEVGQEAAPRTTGW